MYDSDGYYPTVRRPIYVRINEPVAEPVEQVEDVQPAAAPRTVTRTVYYTDSRGHRHRSTKKSVAIVAGSAGVGAAIGAIAGGGKGAGIGALAGGGAGFIYDRLTHNH
jgi:hypothetical protein